ncbi:hypothetical protein D3OALGA1CA_2314 [Olavius algarvensis associated proteobacterium Delta 3]|nr:hypothetical protein D3OALGB2SA_216 [Olavius algarvensis associated proteobacterium Delta 3]CAB5116783.1 hypothetical protein D3OALGA1CA_2314 [Olavius algarvensis associated proteobacterium Delta 3]
MLLAGCAVGPDYQKPEVETPESYRLDPEPVDQTVNLKWWEQFDDPVVYELVTTALDNNRDLKIAASRVLQARATLGFTRADRYPSLDVAAGASTGNIITATNNKTEDTQNTAYIALPLSYEIDFWGKFWRATEAARAELLASDTV